MITTSAITTGLNEIFAALTPLEKWEAARQPPTYFMQERWFIISGLVAIILLTVLLIFVSYHRRMEERRSGDKRFFENADKIGLTKQEHRILLDIADRAGLKQSTSIFSMIEAFDHGASGIIEDTLASQGIEASKRLSVIVTALREKLGYEKQNSASVGSGRHSSRPNSRQIPTEHRLELICSEADDPVTIESTVLKNDDVQLTARTARPLQKNPGDACCVRYYFGGSVWEFDTTVVSCQEDELVLNHSKNVRFINRRRFLRVPVRKPAFITHFPFVKTLPTKTRQGKEKASASMEAEHDTWGTLNFVPAMVTELAGPGLRVEVPLKVKIGQRVLIILKLSEENQSDTSTSDNENQAHSNVEQRLQNTPVKIVEDIGQIRHVKALKEGFSTGIELTGLSDSDVSELIRATNVASMKLNANTQETASSDIEDEQSIAEPALSQEM